MDTHWGKYDGPTAALASSWNLNGDYGQHDWSQPDIGEGTILWDGSHDLSAEERAELMGEEFECTAEEVDALSAELRTAAGVLFSWDSQGFLYGHVYQSAQEYAEMVAEVDRLNAAEDETRVDIVDGWSVEYDAPTLRILEGDTVRFESHEWNPNMSDPREDALSWASAVADAGSGLTIEDDDSDAYSNGVRYVREHAPQGFADECSMLAEEHDHQLAAGRCMQAGCSYRDETAEGFAP